MVLGALLLLWIAWHLSVKNWFTGPKTTIDLPPSDAPEPMPLLDTSMPTPTVLSDPPGAPAV